MNNDTQATLERRGALALLRIANPPVNALSAEVIAQLGAEFFEQARARARKERMLAHSTL